MLPSVSVMMPTYGRWYALQEAVQSFLYQDYQGDAQLVIGNDCDRQKIIDDGSAEITVINYDKRFPTLLDKRDAMVAHARHPWLLWWDADDIYLPHHLSVMVDSIKATMRLAWRCPWMFADLGGATLVRRQSTALGSLICNKALLHKVGGIAGQLRPELRSGNPGSGTDLVNTLACQGYLTQSAEDFPKLAPTFIYRRAGVQHHVSNALEHGDLGHWENLNGYADVEAGIAEDITRGSEPHGSITLSPRWSRDWTAHAAVSAAALGLSYE